MEFSSLMLDIKNMSEEDKLFNFMSGLQQWAQAELRWQGVKDLPTAIAAADSLSDYTYTNANGAESSTKKKHKKGEDHQVRPTADDKSKSRGCFLFEGPHRMRVCPKCEEVNAIVAECPDEIEDGTMRVNPLQLLGSLRIEEATSSTQ